MTGTQKDSVLIPDGFPAEAQVAEKEGCLFKELCLEYPGEPGCQQGALWDSKGDSQGS